MLETLKKYAENQGIEDNYPKKYITKKKKALMEQSNANNQRF